MKLSIHNIWVQLARIKRKILKKNYWNDKQFPSYWFNEVFSGGAASIVQIGSNDGKTGDPLHPLILANKKWKALFVEPVPYSFEKLKSNYPPSESRFSFENSAINDGSKMPFYMVDIAAKDQIPDLPYWFDQLGSFDKSHIEGQLDGKLDPFITSTIIEGLTLQNLLDRNGIEKIDIFHIDTEGYDWNILKQLDLNNYKPAFILFESEHLSRQEISEAKAFLKKDYVLFKQGIDTLAVKKEIDGKVLNKMIQSMEMLK